MVEMVGVLAVISILASLLAPQVLSAINDARVASTASSCGNIKIAVNDYFGRYGLLGGLNGVPVAFVDGAPFEDWDRQVLLAGGFIERAFIARIGNGLIGADAGGSRLRLVSISANIATSNPASADADLEKGAYDLDGTGGDTDNDVLGTTVVEAVIEGVDEFDARALNDRIDGPLLAAPADGDNRHDVKGRVKYRLNDGQASIRVYIAHR